MKRLSGLLATALTISTAAVSAQEVQPPSVPTTQRVSVGANIGVTNTMVNPVITGIENDMLCATAAVFGRVFTGEHFALQAELSYRYSEKEFAVIYFGSPFAPGTLLTLKKGVRYHALTTLLHAQYFLLSSKHQLRPYFSAGAGLISYHYRISVTQDKPYESYFRTQLERSIVLQLAQGLIYDINAKWQFNQSLYYQYEHNGQNTIGINVGAAYRLR